MPPLTKLAEDIVLVPGRGQAAPVMMPPGWYVPPPNLEANGGTGTQSIYEAIINALMGRR